MGICVFGVGYDSGGDYSRYIDGKESKEFSTWKNMMARCHGQAAQRNRPSCLDSKHIDEWADFQVFALWCNTQPQFEYDGWHLDKDLLVQGNKEYGPETCRFVPHQLNSLLLEGNKKADLPKGLSFHPQTKKYRVRVNNQSKKVYDKLFKTIEDAKEAYTAVKEMLVKEQAEIWKDKISSDIYQSLINYKVVY